jgi:putative aldouronate transport system substrate-binding protein
MASAGEPVFCAVGGANVYWIDSASTPELYKHYITLAPLKGPNGLQQSTFLKYDALVPNQFVITKNCKYPEAALRWADYFYSLEGANNEEIGPKGEANWTDAAAGDKGLDGNPALYIRKRAYSNEPQNVNWQDTGITFKTSEIRLGEKTDQSVDIWSAAGLEKLLFDETKTKYVPNESKDFEVIPYLKLTPQETQDLQTIKVELNKYISESRTRFITGDLKIDKEWDSYVKNLDKIGLQKYISVQQAAYDRQFSGK